jgi:hypothetical protein
LHTSGGHALIGVQRARLHHRRTLLDVD